MTVDNSVDDAAKPKRMMWRVTEAPWRDLAEVFVLFLSSVQLVPRSGVLTLLDLDNEDVTLRFAEVFRSLLSGVCGSSQECFFQCHRQC